jgi:hypothetical protein
MGRLVNFVGIKNGDEMHSCANDISPEIIGFRVGENILPGRAVVIGAPVSKPVCDETKLQVVAQLDSRQKRQQSPIASP